MISVWKNFLVVNIGSPSQRSSPLDLAISSEENDISDTSKSANRNCLQKSSDGWIALGIRVTPSGLTFPSKIGQVLGLEAIPMLMGMFMTVLDEVKCTEKSTAKLTRIRGCPRMNAKSKRNIQWRT